jgi:hypothetical protein
MKPPIFYGFFHENRQFFHENRWFFMVFGILRTSQKFFLTRQFCDPTNPKFMSPNSRVLMAPGLVYTK